MSWLLNYTPEEIEYLRCENNVEHFISRHVWIEDKTVPAGIAPFSLWPKQREVLHDLNTQTFLIMLKARQLGLTWEVLADTLHKIMFQAGYTAIAISKRDDPDAIELGLRMQLMLRHLPDWMICQRKGAPANWQALTWSYDMHEIRIHRPGGEDGRFLTLPASPDTAHSFTANRVILDEWALHPWAEQIWTGAFPTMNRPGFSGQVIGLSTGRPGTMFEQIWQDAVDGINRFKAIFLNWRADPRRDDAWYADTKVNLPNTYRSQYPNTPEEAFSSGEGAAFPEFSLDIHVCPWFEIPEYWRRWRAVDNGYSDPFAWYWFAVDEDGVVYIYREYTREPSDEKVAYSQQAKKVKELSQRKVLQPGSVELVEQEERIGFTVAGHDAWHTNIRDVQGKSLIDYYHDGGLGGFIKSVQGIQSPIIRKATMHEYLRPYEDKNTGRMMAKVQILKGACPKLVETLPQLLVDEKQPEKVADSSLDHWYESVSYGLVAWHLNKSKIPEPEKGDIQRDKEKLAKLSQGHRMRRRKLG